MESFFEAIGEFFAELMSEIADNGILLFLAFSSWLWFVVAGVGWALYAAFVETDMMLRVCGGLTLWWIVTLFVPLSVKDGI